MTPGRTHQPSKLPLDLQSCATAMAVVGTDLVLRAINPALHEWLGAATRSWRGEALALLDAKPPQLVDAATHAFAGQRRVWLRAARLRCAMGDRSADLALTPLDPDWLLIEVLPATPDPAASTRWSDSLRGFAHEVRGPLAGVRGAAQLLQRQVGDAGMAELASVIIGEVDRLAVLSDRLLHAGAKPRLARINPHEVIERVVALIGARNAAPRIQRDYDPSLPTVALDADRLQQALLNLAHNACEAGATELILRTRIEQAARLGGQAGPALRIDVDDDGHGVPVELADTLFEPLVSGRADGSGLGLAIAREIARDHGGELSHVSRPGATVFSLLLPLGD